MSFSDVLTPADALRGVDDDRRRSLGPGLLALTADAAKRIDDAIGTVISVATGVVGTPNTIG